jgi:hypothetical protein
VCVTSADTRQKPIIFRCVSRSSSYSIPWGTANAYQVMWSWMRVIRPGPHARARIGNEPSDSMRRVCVSWRTGRPAAAARDSAIAAHRYDGGLRRTKGWGAVLAALVSGLVLRSLCYTVTASRSAVTAAV